MLMRLLLLILEYSVFVFRLPISKIAYCLIKMMSLDSEGSSFESPYFVTDKVLNLREKLALCTVPTTNNTSLQDRIMWDLNFIRLLCHFGTLIKIQVVIWSFIIIYR